VRRAIVPQTKLKKEKNSHVETHVMVIQERDEAAGPSTSIPHCCYSAEKNGSPEEAPSSEAQP